MPLDERAFGPETLRQLFTYHPPTPAQVERYAMLRDSARDFADRIIELCPESTDRTVAIRLLRECVMTANSSIALEIARSE